MKEVRIGIKKVQNGFLVGITDAKDWESREMIFTKPEEVFSYLRVELKILEESLLLPAAVEIDPGT